MKNITNIVTIDPFLKKNFSFKDNELKRIPRLGYNSSNFVTSFIPSNKVIISVLEISANIMDEDVADVLNLKAYEELGLDQAKEYQMEYISQGRFKEYERYIVCIVDPLELNDIFEETLDSTKYLDLLVPAPLLYKGLYDSRIVATSPGVHSYLYFSENDIFITFYRDGDYFYSKTIEGSITEFHSKYMEETESEISVKDFLAIFKKGLENDDHNKRQLISRNLTDVFSEINAIIIYAKRSFDFEQIESFFYSTTFGNINGVSELSYYKTGYSVKEIPFDFRIESIDSDIDILHFLMVLYSQKFLTVGNELLNFLIYDRPPAFHKRASGQFIMSFGLAVIIGVSVPGYFLGKNYFNQVQIYMKEKEVKELDIETNKYQTILSNQRKKLKEINEKVLKKKKIYDNKNKTIRSIYDKKVHYKMKSDLLHQFSVEINNFGIEIEKVKTKDDFFFFYIVSDNEDKITDFIKNISSNYYKKIRHIDIKSISYNEEKDLYYGTLEVDLK